MSVTRRSSPAVQWRAVVPFLLVVALLGLLGIASVQILSAVRAYVGGESLWSKGQKDASAALDEFLRSGDARHRLSFERALAVPLGDRIARLELDRPRPDFERVRQGFLQGGNHPDDIAGMIRLYRHFRTLPFMADAIAIWAEADAQIVVLQRLADEIDRAGPGMSEAQRAEFRQRAAALDEVLTGLEQRFSARLGEASRSTQALLSGATVLLALGLAAMGAVFVQRALSRLAASERSLREVNERWNVAADAAGLGLFEWDPARRELLFDERTLALHGLAPRDPPRVSERELGDTMHPDDRPRMTAAADAVRERREDLWGARYRVPLPDGSVRHVEIDCRRRADGHSLAGVMRDVSDAVQADQLRLDKLAAERARDAKSAFLSRASHELRTPLNAVLGFAQMMRLDREAPLGAEQAGRLRHVERGADQLLRLVNQMLDLSDIDDGAVSWSREPVDLARLLSRVRQQVEPLRAAHGAQIETEVEGPPPRVESDPRGLELVFANLIANAIKFGPPRGTVRLQLSSDGGHAQVAVRDRGRGMDAGQLGHLYEPFNRLGAEYSGLEGAGLGLVVTRRVLDHLGGTLAIDSTPGQGTTVTVRLPLARS